MATDAHALPAAVRADRRALTAIAAGHMSSDLCQGAVPALLPFLIRDRGLSYAAATALLLALTVSSSVIQPVLGHASDRMQGAWLMPAGVLVGGVGIAVVGLTGTYAATLCAVIVGGVGVAAFHHEGARYVPLVAGSGASTGMAAISLLLYLSGESAGEGFHKVKRADRYAIMFEIVVLAAFLVLLGGAAGPLLSGHLARLFWGGLVVAGLVIPLLIDLTGLKLLGAVPAALVLVGGFILRYVIVMANA
jgi:MFS family permease